MFLTQETKQLCTGMCVVRGVMSEESCARSWASDYPNGWTFPVSLMEAMSRFMEHKVKKSQFSLFVAIGSIYIFVFLQKLLAFLLLL